MNNNFNINVQLIDANDTILELSHVLMDVILYMKGHVRYRFHAGETNDRGCLSVSFNKLEHSRIENQKYSLMDYNTKIQDCDSRISIVVLSIEEIQQRRAITEESFPEDISRSVYFGEINNGQLLCNTIKVDVDLNSDQVLIPCMRKQ